ncbi:unnamed protein product [Meganyctiphanes norvegica]|uniref:Kazal-like domain-containing protein n=1 Tax=Meganyctiphanes norvegica TaxID=48144 RepID=A0AAV2S4D5_MEGNR
MTLTNLLERFGDKNAHNGIRNTDCGLTQYEPCRPHTLIIQEVVCPGKQDVSCWKGHLLSNIQNYRVFSTQSREGIFKFDRYRSIIELIKGFMSIGDIWRSSFLRDVNDLPYRNMPLMLSPFSPFVAAPHYDVIQHGDIPAYFHTHLNTFLLTHINLFIRQTRLTSRLDPRCLGAVDISKSRSFSIIVTSLEGFLSNLDMFLHLGMCNFNTNQQNCHILYTIYRMVRILGPVLGFLLGSSCLSLWINPSFTPDLNLKDPRWLGAWWIGYALLGTILTVLGALFFLFPPTLPEMRKREVEVLAKEAKKRAQKEGGLILEHVKTIIKEKNLRNEISFVDLMESTKRLFKNKIVVGDIFNAVFFALGVTAYGTFTAKYMESQFGQSASGATLIEGLAGLISSILGFGISGLVLRFYQPTARSVIGYNVFITLWTAVTFLLFSQIGCPKIEIIGPRNELATTEEMLSSSNIMSVSGHNKSCSSDCGCSDRFEPVCGQDGQIYYSPCYAGCTQLNVSLDQKIYINCQCIDKATAVLTDNAFTKNTGYGSAKKGYCPTECSSIYIYIGVGIFAKMITASGKVGSLLVFMRAVEERDKALGLGFLTFFLSVFGFIPAPIIMGAVIDSTCLVWDWRCGARGNCWFYNTDTFRLLLHAVPGIFVFISVFGDLLMFYYSQDIKLYGETEEDKNGRSHRMLLN